MQKQTFFFFSFFSSVSRSSIAAVVMPQRCDRICNGHFIADLLLSATVNEEIQ